MTELEVEDRPQGWWERTYGEGGPWGFPLSVSSQGLVVSFVVRSGAGALYSIGGVNTNAAAVFVQLFDIQQHTLTAGDVPEVVIPVGIGAGFYQDYSRPRAFKRGIVVASSTTSATFTASTATLWVDVQHG